MTKAVKAVTVSEQAQSSQAIAKRIEGIKAAFNSTMNEAQDTALAILTHVDTYGECSLANKLVSAINSSSQRNALKRWFMAFGKMSYSMKKKELVFKKDFKTDLDGARQVKFWNFEKEEKFTPFNLENAIQSLIARAEKAANDTEVPEGKAHKVPMETLAKLKALAV